MNLPLKFENNELFLLDQRLIPVETTYHKIDSAEKMFWAIKEMVVRGAPLIGFSGIWGMALFAKSNPHPSKDDFAKCGEYLISSRPTAVNLAYEINRAIAAFDQLKGNLYQGLVELALSEMNALESKNRKMAQFVADDLLKKYGERKLNVMTICNTGHLACGVLGTALGVIMHLNEQNRIQSVYPCETRPWLQGSRLTAFELKNAHIDFELIAEGAMSYLMKNKKIDAIFVGADRIVSNGDTANKVGTSTLAIVAKRYGVPFYVVAPLSTFDLNSMTGKEIEIELRPEDEVLSLKGMRIAPEGSRALNPSFDVTDADLITGGIACEKGLISPVSVESIHKVVR